MLFKWIIVLMLAELAATLALIMDGCGDGENRSRVWDYVFRGSWWRRLLIENIDDREL